MSAGDEFFAAFLAEVRALDEQRPIEGLTPEEIDEVRRDQGVASLPAYYAVFLRLLGRRSGAFLVGTDVLYPTIIGLKASTREALEQGDVSSLMPDDAVVVAVHGGYEFYWLEPDGSPDPPLVKYEEGEPDIERRWDRFSDYLTWEVREQARLRAEIRTRRT
ncbi:MAG TPA: SMI1/KNR4 family protein [Micromonosporaceae bacterium]|jgi:hypothetical protein